MERAHVRQAPVGCHSTPTSTPHNRMGHPQGGPCPLHWQPTILKLQFLYFIGMETIHHTERLCASDFLGPGPALAQDQLYTDKRQPARLPKRQGTPGFEPGTIRTAAECSTTELRTHQWSLGPAAKTSLLPGFEPGLPDSRSGVLTTTLQELLLLIILLPAAGAFSSVVERPFCIRKVEGSNPSSSIRHILHADSQQREAPMQANQAVTGNRTRVSTATTWCSNQ